MDGNAVHVTNSTECKYSFWVLVFWWIEVNRNEIRLNSNRLIEMKPIWIFFLSILWRMVNSNDVRYIRSSAIAVYYSFEDDECLWDLFHSNNHNCMQTRFISVTLSIFNTQVIKHRASDNFSLIIINTNISLLLFSINLPSWPLWFPSRSHYIRNAFCNISFCMMKRWMGTKIIINTAWICWIFSTKYI